MPLVVNCSCGKRLQVGDHLAGKKFRCPGCQAVLEAPAIDESGTAVLPSSSGASAPPPPPKKSRTVAIPAQPMLAQPVVAAVVQSSGDDDESSEDDAPKKKKKKKKKSKPSSSGPNWGLIAALGGGVLLLALMVIGAVFVLPKMYSEAELDELVLYQADPEMFVSVDTEKMFATDQGYVVKEMIVHSSMIQDNKFFKAMDVQLGDIKRFTMYQPYIKDDRTGIIVISCTKKINRSKIDDEKSVGRADLNGRSVWNFGGGAGGNGMVAYLLPGDKTMVVGPRPALEALTKIKGGTAPGQVPQIVQKGFDSGKHLYVYAKNPDPNMAAPNAASAPFMPMAKFQTVQLGCLINTKSNISVVLDYGDTAKANAANLSYKSLPLLLGTMSAAMIAGDPQQKEGLNQFIKFLRETKPKMEGSVVTLNIDIPQEMLNLVNGIMAAGIEGGYQSFGRALPPGAFGTFGGGPIGGGGPVPGGGPPPWVWRWCWWTATRGRRWTGQTWRWFGQARRRSRKTRWRIWWDSSFGLQSKSTRRRGWRFPTSFRGSWRGWSFQHPEWVSWCGGHGKSGGRGPRL